MIYSIVNSNHDNPALNVELSEWIYTLESQDIIIHNFVLKQLKSIKDCEEVHEVMSSSDMVLYVSPLDSPESLKRLDVFLDHYSKNTHPVIYLILYGERTLSVEEVTTYIEKFEYFSETYDTEIVDVQYLKDAKAACL